jgi:plasmid stabilization system protein ParE
MEKVTYKIRWSDPARRELKRFISYIKSDSPQNAENVKRDILEKVRSLTKNPERFTPDQFKIENDGSVRYFELYSMRISFEISDGFIDIIRCRHTSRKPENF